MNRYVQREEIYYLGNYMEVDSFPVMQKKKYQRAPKRKPTTEMQAKLNERNSKDLERRLAHLNFTGKDIAICPTFRDPEMRKDTPENEARAKREWSNFRRRLGRLYQKNGVVLKYMGQLQYTKGTGWHFHLYMTGGPLWQDIKNCWGLGRCYIDPLEFDENGIAGYVEYITKGGRYTKRWIASKNLIRPEPEQRDGRLRKKEIFLFRIEDKEAISALYPGYVCTEAHWEYNELYGGQYLRARFYKKGAPFYYDQYDRKHSVKNPVKRVKLNV